MYLLINDHYSQIFVSCDKSYFCFLEVRVHKLLVFSNPRTQEAKHERFLIDTQHNVRIFGIGYLQHSDEKTDIRHKNCHRHGGLVVKAPAS